VKYFKIELQFLEKEKEKEYEGVQSLFQEVLQEH
jgi:hypothetical protein